MWCSLPLLQDGAEVLAEVATLLDIAPQLLEPVLTLQHITQLCHSSG